MNKNLKKHVNLDFLYKILGMQLRDKVSFALQKKMHTMDKGSKVFTVMNLSYFINEFHSVPTLELIKMYISLFSHNLFFFEETKFEDYNKRDNYDENMDSNGMSEHGEDSIAETFSEVMDNYNDLSQLEQVPKLNSVENKIPLRIDHEMIKKINENNDLYNIKSGAIKISKVNKLVTLVFELKTKLSFHRLDLTSKLSKEKYIDTVEQNVVKMSHSVGVLDIDKPLEHLELSGVYIFDNPKTNLLKKKDMYNDIEKYYSSMNYSDKYDNNSLIEKCLENYEAIYK